jgi:hypothetical protein
MVSEPGLNKVSARSGTTVISEKRQTKFIALLIITRFICFSHLTRSANVRQAANHNSPS